MKNHENQWDSFGSRLIVIVALGLGILLTFVYMKELERREIRKTLDEIVKRKREANDSRSNSVSPPPQTILPNEVFQPQLTIPKNNRIENGMSYSEVCRILGSQGQKEQLIDKSNQQSSYNWVTSQGIVRARFENGRLVEKVQFGLK